MFLVAVGELRPLNLLCTGWETEKLKHGSGSGVQDSSDQLAVRVARIPLVACRRALPLVDARTRQTSSPACSIRPARNGNALMQQTPRRRTSGASRTSWASRRATCACWTPTCPPPTPPPSYAATRPSWLTWSTSRPSSPQHSCWWSTRVRGKRLTWGTTSEQDHTVRAGRPFGCTG